MLRRAEHNKKTYTPIWSDVTEDVEEMEGIYTRESIDDLTNTLENLMPVQISEKLFDTIIDHIVNQAVSYARQKNIYRHAV